MSDFNMPEKLWDVANIITGFGILQSIATLFAVTKGELKSLTGGAAHIIAACGALVFGAAYIFAIRWVGCAGASLDNAANTHVWHMTTYGRVGGITLFTLVMIFAVWGHWHDRASEQSGRVILRTFMTCCD